KEITNIAILEAEFETAEAEWRAPRLLPFELLATLSLHGIDLQASRNCKTRTFDGLNQFGIPKDVVSDQVDNSYGLAALPIMSGKMEDIFLHSVGKRYQYEHPKTHQVTFFRKWEDKEDKLYWTLPPLVIRQQDSPWTVNLDIEDGLLKRIQEVISKLQRIETIIVHAKIKPGVTDKREELYKEIIPLYQYFSTLTTATLNDDLSKHLYRCELFLSELHQALNNGYVGGVVTYAEDLDVKSQQQIKDLLHFADELEFEEDRAYSFGV